MLEIVTDSSALYTPEEARQAHIHMVPLQIMADRSSYRDNDTISPQEMVRLCRSGARVSTSQPSMGEKMELYNQLLEDPETRILDLTMTDTLSGTHYTAQAARLACSDPDRVTIFNTRTLAGPHRTMVETALALKDQSIEEIISVLESMTDVSTVTVTQMEFLERGGRLPKGAGSLGDLFRLMPTVRKNNETGQLEVMTISRTWRKVFEKIAAVIKKAGLAGSFTLWILDADNPDASEKAMNYFKTAFPEARLRTAPLSPLFMVHGGPGCLAIQAIGN